MVEEYGFENLMPPRAWHKMEIRRECRPVLGAVVWGPFSSCRSWLFPIYPRILESFAKQLWLSHSSEISMGPKNRARLIGIVAWKREQARSSLKVELTTPPNPNNSNREPSLLYVLLPRCSATH
jgi:hypothetical protein